MGKKQENNYFDMCTELVGYANEAAENLHTTLQTFNITSILQATSYLHAIEHNADIKKHEMMTKLAREFITPIEREDIIQLSVEIDNVTDTIEDVLLKIYMFNIATIREDAIKLAEVVVKCCKALKNMMAEFGNFRKSTTIHEYIVEINRLEEVGDKLYTEAMYHLCSTSTNPIEILAWSDTLECLEKCCDSCEHVSDVVESVIMKNS